MDDWQNEYSASTTSWKKWWKSTTTDPDAVAAWAVDRAHIAQQEQRERIQAKQVHQHHQRAVGERIRDFQRWFKETGGFERTTTSTPDVEAAAESVERWMKMTSDAKQVSFAPEAADGHSLVTNIRGIFKEDAKQAGDKMDAEARARSFPSIAKAHQPLSRYGGDLAAPPRTPAEENLVEAAWMRSFGATSALAAGVRHRSRDAAAARKAQRVLSHEEKLKQEERKLSWESFARSAEDERRLEDSWKRRFQAKSQKDRSDPVLDGLHFRPHGGRTDRNLAVLEETKSGRSKLTSVGARISGSATSSGAAKNMRSTSSTFEHHDKSSTTSMASWFTLMWTCFVLLPWALSII
jgi:hypothetical protein